MQASRKKNTDEFLGKTTQVRRTALLRLGGMVVCLIFLAYDSHPKYQLVVAANRDEYYKRSDLPAGFWPENQDLLAGKDLQQGGTWMGITTTGRFAALTNYRDPTSYDPLALSRGHLVQNYLTGGLDPESYLNGLVHRDAEYNGFNLLAGSDQCLYYYSNREKIVRKIEKGIHGLSNSLLDVPWPKVTRGICAISKCLQHEEIDVESLFAVMADRQQPADQELPQTGVGIELERMLGPMFVKSPDYGTKSTTVLLVGRDQSVRFWERSFKPDQLEPWNEVCYEFKIRS